MTTTAERRDKALASLGLPASDRFTWTEVERDGATASLRFHLDGVGELVETWRFDGVELTATDARHDRALRASLRLLHLLAGVSYLKATLPPRLDPGPLSAPAHALLHAVVTDGLAELAWVNDVDLRDHFEVPAPSPAPAPATPIQATNGPLVPVGGGKDSIVTLDAVRGHGPTLFAVNPKGPIIRTIEAAGLPAVTVERRLDPRLFELNAQGAINGHVPVTAIVSAGAVVAAVAGRHRAVLLSNERSADQATVVTADGRSVNHQWSKTSAFETAFSTIVHDEVAPDVDYLSLLRPLSELAIARRFTGLTTPDGGRWDGVFNSCNRAFHLQGREQEWCGQCPKCRFVFLALAPFMGRDRVVDIFGRDLLDDATQVDDFADLAGIGDHKPFECVGEEEESAAALAWLAGRQEWRDDAVLEALRDRLPVGPDALQAHLARPDLTTLPTPWRDVLR